VTIESVGGKGAQHIYRMGHLWLSTWHIFGVCQVAKKQSAARSSANFSERRKAEVRGIAIPRTPLNRGKKKDRGCYAPALGDFYSASDTLLL
jgi:hypothetical protein